MAIINYLQQKMEYVQLLITSLLALAGSSRLPAKLIIKDETISEQNIMQNMELAIQDYKNSIPDFAKKLHDNAEKQKILKEITSIIANFDCTIKDSYLKLWENFLNKSTNNKDNLELMNKIMEKMTNKKLKSTIEINNKTPSKINNSIKTLLNISSEFTSIFISDVLDKKEQLILNNIIQKNVNHTSKLDTFLEVIDLKNNIDEDMLISLFYNEVRQITEPNLRNQYYNLFMSKLVSKMTCKVGKDTRLVPIDSTSMKSVEHIFTQVYLYFINYELVKKLNDDIVTYTQLKNLNWFSYQVNEFPTKLSPNWNFKPKGFNLDQWQKNTIKAIDAKQNILLSLPTSAGKTVLSTYAIRTYNKVCYLVPSEALAYQLTGMMLASLDDVDDMVKNVRHETSGFSFKKYPTKPDDIIIATPIEFYNLLENKTINPKFDYVIIDEFHNISDEILGPYIEYILKFAAYYNIPIMGLSATIPNFVEFHTWLEKIIGSPVFGISERKRFFNQKRFCVKDSHLSQVNPLEHMTIETLKSKEFTHIGLYPKEIMALNNNINNKVIINEKTPEVVTLDKLHIMEGDIFNYLKSESDETLNNILKLTDTLDTESPTLYKLFKIMREAKDMRMMPMLIFKMEPQECMDIYHNMLNMLKEYEVLVYPSFNSVNKIIEAFFESFQRESKKLEPGDSKENNIRELEEKLKDSLYGSDGGTKNQLEEYYRNFVKTKIDPDDLKRFNDKYGANINEDYIIAMRKKHVIREMRMYNSPENMRLRNIFASHPECRMIDTTVSYDEMKKIRRRVNAEITRDTRLKYGLNAPINKISYGHPFMLGIERGIICYNTLMSAALQRVCQQLINSHPFVTFSDKSLAVGINYPIKTVMLLGNTDPNSTQLEKINNTLAHQACGRAGRRGLDSEGYIIYAGVDIKEILIPKYTVVKKNDVEVMEKLIRNSNSSNNFKNFILDEIRPNEPEKVWECKNLIDIDKLAEEMYRLQSGNIPVALPSINTSQNAEIIDDDDNEVNKKNTNSSIKTLEEIKAELMLRINSPKSDKPDQDSSKIIKNYVEIINNINFGVDEEDKTFVMGKLETFDSWEDDADADANTQLDADAVQEPDLKTKIANAEASFM
jgi:hypothetical protein